MSSALARIDGLGAAVPTHSQAHLLVVRAVVDVLEGHLQREGQAVVALAHRIGRDPQVGLQVCQLIRPQQRQRGTIQLCFSTCQEPSRGREPHVWCSNPFHWHLRLTAYLARRVNAVPLAVLVVRVRPREGFGEVRLRTKRQTTFSCWRTSWRASQLRFVWCC